jgi:TPR repeat protein
MFYVVQRNFLTLQKIFAINIKRLCQRFSRRARMLLMVLLAVAGNTQATKADVLYDGFLAYQRHDYASAYADYLKAYQDGNRYAPLYLGILYLNGEGVQKDYVSAKKLFVEALKATPALANCALGTLSFYGYGTTADANVAFQYFSNAIEMDKTHLINSRYWCTPNLIASMKQMAATRNSRAEFYLGEIYEANIMVPQNPSEAFHYYQLAAEDGDERAKQRAHAIASKNTSDAEAAKVLLFCRAKDECAQFGEAQKECATAGNVDQCVNIKLQGKLPTLQCSRNGTGKLLVAGEIPSVATCAYYRTMRFFE